MNDFERAKDWYQNLAGNLERAGVRIRMTKCYPEVIDADMAFVMCVRDEQERKPLP